MAVNIYDELNGHVLKIQELEARVAKLEATLAPKAQVGVVVYIRPDKLDASGRPVWDSILPKRPAMTLINPGNGPGLSASTTYANHVARCKSLGVAVGGYVYTDYSNRPIAEVKSDIDKHFLWYKVNGIFIDETSVKQEHLPYYMDLSAHIRSKGGLVVLNPGTKTIEAHVGLADHIMVSETDAATYRAQVRPAWEANYPASKFWHCVHTCPAAEMPAIVALARSRNAGLIYVTEDVMPNPYDTLTASWPALCAEVAKV